MYTLLEGLFPLIPSGKPCFTLKNKIKISSKTEYLRVNQKKYIGSERKRRESGEGEEMENDNEFPIPKTTAFPQEEKYQLHHPDFSLAHCELV